MINLRVPSLKTFLLTTVLIISSCSNKGDLNDDNLTETVVNQNEEEPADSHSGDNNNDASSSNIQEITLYRIIDGDIRKIIDYPVSGQNRAYQLNIQKHQEIWETIKKTMPPNYLNKLSEFLIYNGLSERANSFVVETSENLTAWKIGIGINYANDQSNLTHSIIHQLGHIVTLNNSQVNANSQLSSCQSFFTQKGCSYNNSYINGFYSSYWDDIWDDYKTSRNSQISIDEFYLNYKNRFISELAASSPLEDIAEVFVRFVSVPESSDLDDVIAENKALRMFDIIELVEIRNHIRANIESFSNKLLVNNSGGNSNNGLNNDDIHCLN